MDVGQERELMALVMGGFSQNGRSPHGTFSSTKLGDSKTIPSFYKKNYFGVVPDNAESIGPPRKNKRGSESLLVK
jgi:hypothetical protein